MEKIKIQDNSGDKKYFTIIPNYIYNHSTLWDREVYCQMKRIAGENGKCWISQKNLSKQCGISINRLKKSIKYLIEHDWITEIGKKQNNKNDTEGTKIYEICDLWKKNNEFYEQKAVSREDTATEKAVSRTSKGGITDEQKAVSPGAYKEEPIKNNIEEDIILHSEQSSRKQEIDSLIELFKPINPSYKRFYGNPTQKSALTRLLKELGREKLEKAIKLLPKIQGRNFAPTITTPYELENKLAALIIFLKKEKSKSVGYVEV